MELDAAELDDSVSVELNSVELDSELDSVELDSDVTLELETDSLVLELETDRELVEPVGKPGTGGHALQTAGLDAEGGSLLYLTYDRIRKPPDV